MIEEQFLTDLNTKIKNYGYSFDTPYEDRKEAFYLSIIYNFIYDYGRNATLIPYNWNNAGKRSFQELRAYAASKQSIRKYKKQSIFPKKTRKQSNLEGQLETYQNISWEPVAVLPKLIDIVVNIIASNDFDIKVMALDPKSIGDKEYMRALNKILLDPQMQQFIKQMRQNGVNVTKRSMFNSIDEENMYDRAVGYQILPEITLLEALKKSNIESKKHETLRMIIRDLVVCGIGGGLDYTDEFTGMPKYKYIDPEYAIIDNSLYSDCRDILRAGHFEMMTIGEIRRMSNMDDAKLKEIAIKYSNRYGNPTTSNWITNYSTGVDAYKVRAGYQSSFDYRIPVFHMRFIGTEMVDGYRHEYVYKASWIVNSNFVFSYGRDSYSPKRGKDGNQTTQLPYHFYKMDDSAVDRVVGMVDDICLNEYKKRNIRSRMIPSPGLVFEEESLNSVNVGGQIFNVQDNLALLYEGGAMVIRSKDQFQNQVGGGRSPITPIPDDSYNKINALTQDSVNQLSMIKDILGINDFIDATNPHPRTGLGVATKAYENALNSMKGYVFGSISIYESLMNSLLLRWQLTAENNYEFVTASFSDTKAKVLKLTKDVSLRKFGIYVTVAQLDSEIAEMKQSLIALRNARTTNGQGGLTGSQYLICSSLLDQRKITECIWIMSEFEETNRKRDMEEAERRSLAMQEQNGQIQQQSIMAKAQADRDEIMLEIQGKLQEQQKENEGKIVNTIIDGMIKAGILKDKQDFLAAMAHQKNEGVSDGVGTSETTRALNADVQQSKL